MQFCRGVSWKAAKVVLENIYNFCRWRDSDTVWEKLEQWREVGLGFGWISSWSGGWGFADVDTGWSQGYEDNVCKLEVETVMCESKA